VREDAPDVVRREEREGAVQPGHKVAVVEDYGRRKGPAFVGVVADEGAEAIYFACEKESTWDVLDICPIGGW
jgi:hypothetical protein